MIKKRKINVAHFLSVNIELFFFKFLSFFQDYSKDTDITLFWPNFKHMLEQVCFQFLLPFFNVISAKTVTKRIFKK